MDLWFALRRLEQTHRKGDASPGDGKWGHWDAPRNFHPLLEVIRYSIHTDHPELFEQFFGFKPGEYKPSIHAHIEPVAKATANAVIGSHKFGKLKGNE
jgi:hypothetical protein